MHISELKANPTLINHVIKVYEFKQGPLEPRRQYWFLQNLILKLIQHLTTENQLCASTLCK